MCFRAEFNIVLKIFFNVFYGNQTSPVSELYTLYWVIQNNFSLKNSLISF